MSATALPGHSVFWKILYAFLAFASCLSIFLGIFLYLGADRLGKFLVMEQARTAMTALEEAERLARRLKDRDAANLEISSIAAAINGKFLVGKQVPEEWKRLDDGIHFNKAEFIYIRRAGPVIYSLSGSSKALRNFLTRIAGLCSLVGVFGLLASVCIAWFLARLLSQPMIRLAGSITTGDSVSKPLPAALLDRQDEIGLIARAVANYQKEADAFLSREAAFTGYVGHELRTPLAILSSSIEILQTENSDPRMDAQMQRISRTIRNISDTVTTLLHLARRTGEEPKLINLANMIQDLCSKIKGCKTEFILDLDESAQIYAEPGLAAIVAGNLLENACHYAADNVVNVKGEAGFLEISNLADLPDGFEGDLNEAPLASRRDSAGLGLQLAQRACARLGWALETKGMSGRAFALIKFKNMDN